MVVTERIEVYPQVRQVMRQAHTFKVGIECPLDDALIGQSIQNFLRNLLTTHEVDDLHRASIHGIAEKQDCKVLSFGITVNSTLADIYAAPSFKIDRNGLHVTSPSVTKAAKTNPRCPCHLVLFS